MTDYFGSFLDALNRDRTEGSVMAYGYIEVEVRLLRQGHGEDSSGVPGSGFAVEHTRTVRMEEPQARTVRDSVETDGSEKPYGALAPVATAVKRVLDADEAEELDRRWRDAEGRATQEQKRAALRVLEG